MTRIVARASAELRTIPGIRNVGGQVGRAVTSDQVVGVNAGELWISIDREADYGRTVAAVEAVIDGYPGLRRAVVTYTSSRIDQVLGQPEPDVVVRLYGQDAAVLGSKAEEVRQELSEIGGLADVAVVGQDYEPTLQIEVDLAAAQRYGLRPGDVRRATATLLSGIEVGFLFEAQKVFEVVVWGVPELRQSLTSIRNVPIQAPGGQFVTLGEVADVRIGSAPSVVSREGVFRYVDVGASVAGRDLDAVLGDVEARVSEIQFPLEHRAEIMGAAAGRQADLRLLLVVTVAAAIGMMLLLQASFGRWRPASFLLVSLPCATVGAVLAGIASGGFFSIGIIAGFLGVVAIAVRQGLLMMSRLQRLEREREGSLRPDLILDGARERLAPILSTAIGTAVAMAPLFALSGRPGLEILGPMALVIVAGLVTSTLFALFVVPAGYLLAGPSPEPDAATLLAEQPGFSPA
jgi:Cu/Ag efflux pump CusA